MEKDPRFIAEHASVHALGRTTHKSLITSWSHSSTGSSSSQSPTNVDVIGELPA